MNDKIEVSICANCNDFILSDLLYNGVCKRCYNKCVMPVRTILQPCYKCSVLTPAIRLFDGICSICFKKSCEEKVKNKKKKKPKIDNEKQRRIILD